MQVDLAADPHYIAKSLAITEEIRFGLIDMLIGFHRVSESCVETLFLAANIFDRHLANYATKSKRRCSMEELTLIAVTALLIASKYEEQNCFTLEEIQLMLQEQGYRKHREAIRRCEKNVLKNGVRYDKISSKGKVIMIALLI